jgi:cytochrome P450
MLLMIYKPRRKHRKIANGFLNTHALDNHAHTIDHETTVLVKNLYKSGKAGMEPINPQPHAGRCSLNAMLTIVFGIRTDTLEHPLVGRVLMLSREFMSVSEFIQPSSAFDDICWHRNCTGPVSNLVDFVPLLQYLPSSLKTRAKKLHQDLVETYGGMMNEIEERMKAGEDVPHCLVKTMIETDDQEALDYLDKTMICSAFMIGGVETVRFRPSVFNNVLRSFPFRRLLSCNGSLHLFHLILIFKQELMLSLIASLAATACLL